MSNILKGVNDIKIRYKLIIIYTFIGLLPMLILFVFCYYQIKNILTQNENESIQSYLYQATISMDNNIKIYNNLSDYISFNQTISQVVRSDYDLKYEMYNQIVLILDPMLASLKYFHDDLNQATIYIESDIVKHDTTLAPISEIKDEDWFYEVKDSNNQNWYVNKKDKKTFLARKMPILDNNGILGILYINVDYDNLFQPFEQAVISNYGIFITNENKEVIYNKSQFDKEFNELSLNYKQFLKEIEKSNNSKYEIVSNMSNETNWRVWLYKPKKLVVRSIQSIKIMILLAVILFVLAFIFILAAVDMIVKRIEKLKNNMLEVEKGNLIITVESNDKDEIGDLIRGFGKMIKEVQILIKEVYESKISEKKNEMKALQAQINPHFLYNTLSLINWKALEAGSEDISRITLALSTFYRTSLNKGKNILKIEDEINNTKSYLEIQSMMHDDDFDIAINIDEEILQYEIINLVLQPLIENAINHGIDLKIDGRGLIKISGEKKDNLIYISVEDNGVGMDEEKSKLIITQGSHGYGVRNVNERIKLQYGDGYGLKVESKVGIGTKITICIPANII